RGRDPPAWIGHDGDAGVSVGQSLGYIAGPVTGRDHGEDNLNRSGVLRGEHIPARFVEMTLLITHGHDDGRRRAGRYRWPRGPGQAGRPWWLAPWSLAPWWLMLGGMVHVGSHGSAPAAAAGPAR